MLTFIRKAILSIVSLAVGMSLYAADAKPARGVIRVKLQPEMALKVGTAPRLQSAGTLSVGVTPLDRAAKKVKAVKIRRMLPYAPKYEAQRAKYGLDRWYVVEFDENFDPAEARRIYAATPGIELSENIIPMELKEGTGKFVTADMPKFRAPAAMPFNDPRLPEQWHYQNFGTIAGAKAGADINLFDAWRITTGHPDVIVAIIDGGVDYRHEDLAQNMHINLAELNGTPGVDDDGNGYVDDIYGFNFCTNSADIYPHPHGTHVAGTVAAVNNNGIGVAGVAGGNGSADTGVRLLSCQVFESRTGTGDGDFAAAIAYAAENGATIAQCSWGWGTPGYYEQAVLDAIDYFTNEARSSHMMGGLCIFAAGNEGATGDMYPACYPPVVSVGAITCDFTVAPYTNFGEWVDIAAPGGLLDYGSAQGVVSTLPNNEYGANEGTSMATPHVSGIAALILSKYGSSTFINETLRTQLVTSVNDLYGHEGNERYRGLLGSGYIDATKALAMGNGEAPARVSDLTADAAQDYIELTWTIPASADNNVNHHIIYFSTSPFDASTDVTTLDSRTVDTKFQSSGDICRYELTGLSAMTTYYVAVVAVNRWGDPSPISEVKSATTNAGPELEVTTTQLTMSSTESDAVAKTMLTIGNKGEGILKWSAAKRTVSAMPQSVSRPGIGRTAPYKGKITGNRMKAYSKALTDYDVSDYPQEMFYHSMLFAYIGDTDRSLPNSMAQWYRVDASKFPDGFNLTHLWIEGQNGTNPKIQIYKGDVAISSASLIADVDYQWFTYNYNIALNEQLYFAPGESFWVVVHFEGNQEGYPLGMGVTDGEDVSAYSYMSNDMGKTWSQLSTALKGSSYESYAPTCTWAIRARSLNPDWSEILELDPASGTVRSGENQEIEISADGRKIVNGTYNFNLRLSTNETDAATKSVPVTLTVSGNAPDVVLPKVVDFGSLLVGQSKTLTVEAYNKGYGKFSGSKTGGGLYSDKISSTNNNFAGPDYLQSGFPARATTTFEVTYKPTEAGFHSGAIEFTDYAGRQIRVLVQGTATEPAKLVVTPSVIEGGELVVGAEPTTKVFTIANQGKYPLEYVFPKFSDETLEGSTARSHKFGYTVMSNLPGYTACEYDGNPELIGGTDISSKFTDDVYVSDPVALGFSFPYYGGNYEKVYISSYGALMFATSDANFWPPLTPNSGSIVGTGMISAYGSQLRMGPQSKVVYARQDGKFVVKFINVLAPVYSDEYTPVSMHITLSANGDIEIFYDDYTPGMVFQEGSPLFCGINDPDVKDPLTITSADMADYWGTEEATADNKRYTLFGSGTAVRFEAPKPLFVRSLSRPAGLIVPGESVDIEAILSADATMYAGATFNNLTILTNDPNPELSALRFNAVISGDELVAKAEFEDSDISFGKVFRTSELRVPVTVKNSGNDIMTITSATSTASEFTVSTELPVTVNPGMSKDIILNVSTDTEGALSGVITIATSVGDITATISGEVIGCPEIQLNIESVEETVASGDPLTRTLEISNPGNEALTYAIAPNSFVTATLPDKADSHVGYTFTSSADNPQVEFDWIDIETNGLGTRNSMSYYLLHDYVAVDLPFEFPFYGKKYSRMYIYNSGFVSFTERNDDRLWPEPPADFPEGTVYNNIIAPYWGLHSMGDSNTAGTYHYVTDDRAVVSFMEYGNSMNFGVCFQLIMEKDGSFKFQYKGHGEDAVIYNMFGLAGISNDSATESIRLPERFVSFGKAVEFNPVVEITLPAGMTDNVALNFNTALMGGVYSSPLLITTNVPSRENIEIPVTLNIQGQPQPVWPDDITVEHTLGYTSTDYNDPMVQMGAPYAARFTLGNSGTANYTIMGAQIEAPMDVDPDFGDEMEVFFLFANQPMTDWITGEPTGEYFWDIYNGMPVSVGTKPMECAVPMMQCNFWNTPGEYDVKVHFSYIEDDFDINGESGETPETLTHTVNVKFIVTPLPAMVMDKYEVSVRADSDDQVFEESITIANEGEYKLDYSLYVDPTGAGEEVPDLGGGGIDPLNAQAKAPEFVKLTPENLTALRKGMTSDIKPFGKAEGIYDGPSDFEYLNALCYPALPGTKDIYNYGSNSVNAPYKAATVFTAPEEGFNMSHLFTAVTIETAQNVDITVEVREGNNPEEGAVIATGELHIASQADPRVGAFFVIPLNHSVYLNPNEEFCVVINYPPGIKAPSYIIKKEEGYVAGRYLGWYEDLGWFDVADIFKDQYGSLGYVMTCLETVKGESWITLMNPETEGSIQPQESIDIRLRLSAASARLEKGNKAMLVIKSNDPSQPVVNVPIVLDKNGAPVIEGSDKVAYAREGEKSTVKVTAFDPDLDNYTLEFTNADGHASVVSVEAAQGDMATIEASGNTWSVSGATEPVIMTVEIAPAYGTAGTGFTFNIAAADNGGHQSFYTGRYDVEHVNRAPQAIDAAPVTVECGNVSEVVNFSDLFTDPDNDDMTYTFEMPDDEYADGYTTPSGVIFVGKKIGTAVATVTATDAHGLSATTQLTVNITEPSGIDSITADSENGEVIYWNLKGIRVYNPGPGTYIVRRGNVVTKETLK